MKIITMTGRITETKSGLMYKSLQEIEEIIRLGSYTQQHPDMSEDYTLKEITELIHSVAEKNPSLLADAKFKYLPAVCFNGVFSELNDAGLVDYSDVIALDFDKFSSEIDLQQAKARLITHPNVAMVYTTPSGMGLKAVVRHDNTDPKNHKNLYLQLARKFGIKNVDMKCSDLSRKNYLCYDPDVYFNPSATPFHYVYDSTCTPPLDIPYFLATMSQQVSQISEETAAEGVSDYTVMNFAKGKLRKLHPEYFEEGHRRDGIYWFGQEFRGCGVNYEKGLKWVKKLYQNPAEIVNDTGVIGEKEIEENFSRGYMFSEYNPERRRKYKPWK